MAAKILFLLKGYPRLSETFIAQEIRSLEKAGFDIGIVALRRPTDDRVHPVHREITADIGYLPEYLHEAPQRLVRALAKLIRRKGFRAALGPFLRDLRRDRTRNRIRRFGQAIILAAEMPTEVERIHAHFIHTPASVARYASLMTDIPWSCSAHAKDIWTTPDWELAEKLAESEFTVTCTRAGRHKLSSLAAPGKPVTLVYHGLDLDRFRPLTMRLEKRNGADKEKPVRLLTVARAVEKKGLDVLLNALARLPGSTAWRWTHVGGGALVPALRTRAAALGLDDRCAFLGPRDQEDVLTLYRSSDIFVLPCRIADDGDRDGLPNVLIEAASQGLAAISTAMSGVPELIEHEVSGLLTPAEDVGALAEALARMIGDFDLRYRFARAGMAKVRSDFDHARAITELIAMFRGGGARLAAPVREAGRPLSPLAGGG